MRTDKTVRKLSCLTLILPRILFWFVDIFLISTYCLLQFFFSSSWNWYPLKHILSLLNVQKIASTWCHMRLSWKILPLFCTLILRTTFFLNFSHKNFSFYILLQPSFVIDLIEVWIFRALKVRLDYTSLNYGNHNTY